MKSPPEKISKILVIRNDKLGDMVVTSGFFRELRNAFPKSSITLIASEQNKAVVEKNPHIDEILTLEFSPKSLKEFIEY